MTQDKQLLKIYKDIRKLERQRDKSNKSMKTNHILHLLLSLLTVGFWIPIWILFSINFSFTNFDKKIEKLYSIKDEIEIKREFIC